MPTAHRVACFTTALAIATPLALVMFKDGPLTRETWAKGLGSAASLALLAAVLFGEDGP
ncbi:hypothetical protein V1L54_02710 [Streptomyces sp. TRM 70361]|uniref:hypothetical protein n=1 Tax=Streptomyces sp. TRM 70361 TaxID=3116553 RepID=UPI002E7BCDC4|nr:hypothetical protein [Streptomyces sp. TRM 70361]MEE1938332.1 hypothetical protein [Streptomyces sp. TRM 70361]